MTKIGLINTLNPTRKSIRIEANTHNLWIQVLLRRQETSFSNKKIVKTKKRLFFDKRKNSTPNHLEQDIPFGKNMLSKIFQLFRAPMLLHLLQLKIQKARKSISINFRLTILSFQMKEWAKCRRIKMLKIQLMITFIENTSELMHYNSICIPMSLETYK